MKTTIRSCFHSSLLIASHEAMLEDEPGYVPHPEGGLMLSVIEKCRFEKVKHGIILSSPANWCVIRENIIHPLGDSTPAVTDESGLGIGLEEAVVIDEEQSAAGSNSTMA